MRTSYLAVPILSLAILVGCPPDEIDDDATGDDDTAGDDDVTGDDDDTTAVTDDDGDGWTVEGGDCDDTDPMVHPGADEGCDGIDTDCDGSLGPDEIDDDEDGSTECGGDCDDEDADVGPSAAEVACDHVDNDCNGQLHDEEVDDDGDSHDECSGDCDDDDPAVYPGAGEICDGVDNDCDGDLLTGEVDLDGDGYMACEECDDDDASLTPADADGDGHSTCDGDCDDADASVYPSAPEQCNGEDDDCDGVVPDEETDGDGDGVAPCDGDCDDADPATHPGAPELCDGLDNNCSGSPAQDESDADADGQMPCAGDCDDADPAVYDGAPDVCDAVQDNDCDGTPDPQETDDDGDGVPECGGDCDDADPALNLDDGDGDGHSTCDGDCDDGDASLELDDGDGDGFSTCDGDCDDADASANPGTAEVEGDGVDNDCDGEVDEADPGAPTGTFSVAMAHAKLVGTSDDDLAGWSLAGAGDLNNDGFADLVIGTPYEDEGGSDAGAAYVVHGPVQGLMDLSAADAKLTGEAADHWAAWSVAGAGDVDGDGHGDLLVGALHHGAEWAGAAYLVRGPFSGTSSLAGAEARFLGESSWDTAGSAVAGWGDVDGDGNVDLLVGARGYGNAGKAYLVLGPVSGDYALAGADAAFWGDVGSGYAGHALTLEADLDADGYEDVVVGALGADKTHVMYAAPAIPTGDIYLVNSDAAFWGGQPIANAGAAVSTGDVNGDGASDLLIGAFHFPWGSDRGAAFLVHGDPTGNPPTGTINLTYDADAFLQGEIVDDEAGVGVSCRGDVNGDGYDDLLIGAEMHDEVATNAGAAYLIYGPTSGYMDLGSADAKLLGEEEHDHMGAVLDIAGDINGDGYDDLAIAAYAHDGAAETYRGAVYVVLGGSGP